ncbi:MAG: hypothetical protein GC129_01660 [Proteobacteria bacterium]|nr:hypothetical protein [Pseudomonadota bacterium]
MPKKAVSKSRAKAPKKPVKAKKKAVAPKAQPILLQGVQDASLESLMPSSAFSKGERQLEFGVSAHHTQLPQAGQGRLELRLRAHIHVQGQPVALAEIKYAAVIQNTQKGQDMSPFMAQLYPPARDALVRLLQLAGHEPPLPATLHIKKVETDQAPPAA